MKYYVVKVTDEFSGEFERYLENIYMRVQDGIVAYSGVRRNQGQGLLNDHEHTQQRQEMVRKAHDLHGLPIRDMTEEELEQHRKDAVEWLSGLDPEQRQAILDKMQGQLGQPYRFPCGHTSTEMEAKEVVRKD